MEPVYALETGPNLNRLLRAISTITTRVASAWNTPEVLPLTRRNVFTLDSAVRVHRFAWKNEDVWILSPEDGMAMYKTYFLVQALWMLPGSHEAFVKSQWFTTWNNPAEVFTELMPEVMETLTGELEPWLSEMDGFAEQKAGYEAAVKEVKALAA